MFVDDPLLDTEELLQTLARRDLPPETFVASEVDVTTWDELPYVTHYSITQDGNGPGLWSALVTFNVYGDGTDEAFGVCRDVHRIVRGWRMPGTAVLPGVGAVENAELESAFSRVTTVQINGKDVTQYAGSYTLTLRYIPPIEP